ncbi:MAG TPA: metallophosphoesterase family protein [Gaiellaceae bacterium]|nr:metallophosphoesterase family protein [Gaiellaceae bacterium]
MRVAVVSDIHSNLHALEAVLAAIDADAPDELWCLGDLVGYGPRPNECCAAVEARAAICLAGNHDLAVCGTIDVLEFSGDAARAATWTRDVLAEQAAAFLGRLVPQGKREGVDLYHGSARDPIWEYVLSDEAAEATLEQTEAALVLVGHSHAALVAVLHDGKAAGGLASAGTEIDLSADRCLLNPGSVGQPRDGDPRAAYLLLDLEARRASFRRVDYDIARTQAEIVEAGLPEPLARRLAQGQ